MSLIKSSLIILVAIWVMLVIRTLAAKTTASKCQPSGPMVKRGKNKNYLLVSLTEELEQSSGDSLLIVCVTNLGEEQLTIQDAGVCLADRRELSFERVEEGGSFPFELESNQTIRVSTVINKLAETLSWEGYRTRLKVTPFAKAQDDETYRGDTLTINLEQLKI